MGSIYPPLGRIPSSRKFIHKKGDSCKNPDVLQSRIKTQTGLRTPGKMSHWRWRVTHRRGMPSRRGHIVCISVSAIIPAEPRGAKEREPWGKARQPATAGTDSSHFMAGHFSSSKHAGGGGGGDDGCGSRSIPLPTLTFSLSLTGLLFLPFFTVVGTAMHMIAQHLFKANSSKSQSSERYAGWNSFEPSCISGVKRWGQSVSSLRRFYHFKRAAR